MRAHYLQHVPFEGLGTIQAWLGDAGYSITKTQFYKSPELPDVSEIDFLVVMGGPMSVNDEDAFPWLEAEKRFIRDVIETGLPVLGVCLGAQLIASALGARVYPNPVKEIGWFPVRSTPSINGSVFELSYPVEVFHWHGETFDLPPGATCIANSDGCTNQAFHIGESVIGLQFHLEMTQDSVREIVANCGDELVPAQYVQTEQQILSASPGVYQSNSGLMGRILSLLHRNTM